MLFTGVYRKVNLYSFLAFFFVGHDHALIWTKYRGQLSHFTMIDKSLDSEPYASLNLSHISLTPL